MKRLYPLGILFGIFYFFALLVSCHSRGDEIPDFRNYPGKSKKEFLKVLEKYKDDSLKYEAAKFLVTHIHNKYFYEGKIIDKYDKIFHIYDSLCSIGIYVGDPAPVTDYWNYLTYKYGPVQAHKLTKKKDYNYLDADFLSANIEAAFIAYGEVPSYVDKDFNIFLEYVLPYRAGNENPEGFRYRYKDDFNLLVDSSYSVKKLLHNYHQELRWNRNMRPSGILWDYPIDIPVSKMELGKRGACHHMANYTANLMRASGLPVACDYTFWGNRGGGHEWNVLFLENGKIFPFDAMARDSLVFSYKPAKIFRKTFKNYPVNIPDKFEEYEMPYFLTIPNQLDVTDQYGLTYDIKIPVKYPLNGENTPFICIFDNENWRIVDYGTQKEDTLYFSKIMPDIVYMAAFYEKGKIIPATSPFLLTENGEIDPLMPANNDVLQTMVLERKYPRFKRIEDFAWGLRRANAEVSDRSDFQDVRILFSIYDITFGITDINVKEAFQDRKYRYVRLNTSSFRNGNIALLEFYGKKEENASEVKLTGEIIGYPSLSPENLTPYTNAMDGNLETYFAKDKGTSGWVGLDLGEGNEHIITRVRYCPRSDTNFILIGDTYELFYWNGNQWVSVGQKVAEDFTLVYDNVPAQTLYVLRNHTRGKEERIFTYENGQQVWR